MAYNKEKLMSHFQVIGVDTETFNHPVVLTVEEQAKYIGHLDGGHSKNLFLKDKKGRLYIVSALTATTIDLKALSQRLGLGKGGIRMAPEDTLKEVLKVPLGCVTPFSVINESAKSVALLLDQGFKAKSRIFFHPLSNDSTIALSSNGLDTFLKSIGRKAVYVDFEATVTVGKDQPPDLAVYVPSDSGPTSEPNEKQSREDEVAQISTVLSTFAVSSKEAEMKSSVPSGALKGAQKKVQKNTMKEQSMKNTGALGSDPERLVAHILDEITGAIEAEMSVKATEQHGESIGSVVSSRIRTRLTPDLESIVMLFKNTAYTEGYVSGAASNFRSRC